MKFLTFKLSNGLGTAHINPASISAVIDVGDGATVYITGDGTGIEVAHDPDDVVHQIESTLADYE